MIIDHAAIWAQDLESLTAWYERFFGGVRNAKYVNPVTGFQSYFLHFGSGARLEIMQRDDVPPNANDVGGAQHRGLIHLAFGVPTRAAVDDAAQQFQAAGFPLLRGPRTTGDGYYEFELLDPEGNRLEVCAPPNAPQL